MRDELRAARVLRSIQLLYSCDVFFWAALLRLGRLFLTTPLTRVILNGSRSHVEFFII